MNYLISFLTVAFFFSAPFQAPEPADDCKVLLESISGSYEGDCKKGHAHGNGKSVGTDTYEGQFKKGLPSGKGTYTWANGDVYEGSWNKGVKQGEGVLTLADGSVQTGYWIDDEYIGKEKNPYKVLVKSVSVNRASFKRTAAEPNQLEMKFTRLGKPVKIGSLAIQGSYGVIISESDFSRVINIHKYPFQGAITFSAMANRDSRGGSGGDYVDGNMEFSITQAGSWEVTIEMQSND